MVKKNSIPERWRSLTAIGTRVPGSRFIAFKVPLKGATNQRVTQNQKFTPKDLVTNIRNQEEELGLIIDLTNTERYYTTKDLPRSVQYVKLHTAGLKIPDDATVHQFKRIVRQFLFANEDNDKLIGVHCTTGINRTGYLICRYLIDVEGWRALHAITAFANSRGHPIEGAVYIEDLIKGPLRSNVGIDLPPTEEEQKALNSGSEEMLRDDPGNEFGDFDARGRRSLPSMRSDNCLGDFDARDRRVAPRNILGDHDLRLPAHEPHDRGYMGDGSEPMYPERLGRHGDYHLDYEGFHDQAPRPLMSIPAVAPREMQRRFDDPGMSGEGMDYDMRGRGRPMHAMQSREFSSDMQYDDPSSRPAPLFPRNKMNNFENEGEHRMHGEMPYRENVACEGFVGNEDFRYNSGGTMTGAFRGPVNERMQPRNPRPMGGGPMAERMHPRDSRHMEGPINDSMHSREHQYMDENLNERMYPRDGSMNESFPQRTPRLMDVQIGERGHAREAAYMEDPRNERMPPRDMSYMDEKLHPQEMRNMEGLIKRPPFMKGPQSERMHTNPPRHMPASMNERMDPRDGQNMEGPAYDRMQVKDPRAMDGPMYDRMQLKDPRAMGGPMNVRIPPRAARPMENSMVDQGYSGGAKAVDSSTNQHMYSREPQAMQGSMNDGMYPKFSRPMDNTMKSQMYSNTARSTDGSMNQWMPQNNARAMERPVNEHIHLGNSTHPREPQAMDGSMHKSYARPFENRNMNASEETLRAPNRFTPYPPKKPTEAQGLRGPPAHPLGMPGMHTRFPTNSRFQ